MISLLYSTFLKRSLFEIILTISSPLSWTQLFWLRISKSTLEKYFISNNQNFNKMSYGILKLLLICTRINKAKIAQIKTIGFSSIVNKKFFALNWPYHQNLTPREVRGKLGRLKCPAKRRPMNLGFIRFGQPFRGPWRTPEWVFSVWVRESDLFDISCGLAFVTCARLTQFNIWNIFWMVKKIHDWNHCRAVELANLTWMCHSEWIH